MGASAAGYRGTDKRAADLELRGCLSVCVCCGGGRVWGWGGMGHCIRWRLLFGAAYIAPHPGVQNVLVEFCFGSGPVLKEGDGEVGMLGCRQHEGLTNLTA